MKLDAQVSERWREDPLATIAANRHLPAVYWRNDARGQTLAALGATAEVRTEGPGRFAEAMAALGSFETDSSAEVRALPLLVGGFAFDDRPAQAASEFAPLRFFVPSRLWWATPASEARTVQWRAGRRGAEPTLRLCQAGERSRVASNIVALESSERREAWAERVRAVQRAIDRGEVEKAVLSRSCVATLAEPVDCEAFVEQLARERPQCWTFLVRFGGRTFVGSTPERLAAVDGGVLEADALAGSRPRGADAEEDARLSAELTASEKEGSEHRFVVDAVTGALESCSTRIDAPTTPAVLALPEALHLHTPVRAELSRPLAVLQAAARLHPTPAVCGTPRDSAARIIRDGEPDRGWYTGAVGYVDAGGGGDLAVALRTAEVAGASARVRAGAGIVARSDADAEFDETETKMSAMLRTFDESADERAA